MTKDILKKLKDSFKQKINFEIDAGRFILKTASDYKEVEELLKLRYDIYYKELLGIRDDGIDVDNYDLFADHIMIIDKITSKPVATYRILSNLFTESFYSESEFKISDLSMRKENKIEVGRACVHSGYRKGIMILLLWRAIFKYAKLTDSRFVFGCSSVQTTDKETVSHINSYLHTFRHPENIMVYPHKHKEVADLKSVLPEDINMDLVNKNLPPLLKSYINNGGFICGEPALDKEFKCVDFFTLVDIPYASSGFKRYVEMG